MKRPVNVLLTAALLAAAAAGSAAEKQMIWADLFHLSTNMWNDDPAENYQTYYRKLRALSPKLLCDREVWNSWVDRMRGTGMNMIVIDLGDGVRFDTHPEIAIEGSWTKDELKAELKRLRGLGFEPIPKLNFSTRHDSWMKIYHRMVSTPQYYQVCADLIKEAGEMFDHPRFFHLGMDEESPAKVGEMSVARIGRLWWHDLNFLCKEVEKNGMRPWIWVDVLLDAVQNGEDLVFSSCPKSTVVSSYEYDFGKVGPENPRMKGMKKLAENGYDIIPCASNWGYHENMRDILAWALADLPEERLLGVIMAPWTRTVKRNQKQGLRAVDSAADAISMYEHRNDPERMACSVWFVKEGEKIAYRTNYPEDRLQYRTGDQLVLDFGMTGPMRPILEVQHSHQNVPCTIRVQAASRLDGRRAIPEGEVLEYVLKEGEYRVEMDKVLGPARYLVITADKKFFITDAFARKD